MKNRILKLLAASLVCLSLVTLGGCSILEQFLWHEHEMSYVAEKEATCTQSGEEAHYHCGSCGKNFEDEAGNRELHDLTIPALGHDGEHVDAKQASCLEDGNTEYYVCSRCHLAFADETCTKELEEADYILPAMGHKPAEGWKHDSITHYRVCITCGARMDAAAHTYGEDGLCTVCGYEQGADDVIYGNKEDITSADLSIHFLELGTSSTGDCVLIKTGNTEVLIDAGAIQGSITTIREYVDQYCTDGVLEYVIATHADQDHIAAMVGRSSGGNYNGILYSYDIRTIIKFDRSDKDLVTDKGNPTLYSRFLTAVDYAESNGAAVYTGLQCYNQTDGAQRTYYLDEERTISMNILYNYYYDHSSSDENNYSVCMLLTQELENGEANNYLFTGDLEKEGEEYLVEYNELPEVELFKAGHHGSPTSSNDVLLDVIKPKNIVACCCCGSDEYTDENANQFPSQAFITRASKHTENIYVPTIVSDNADGYESMNGDIVFYYNRADGEEEGSLKLWCSNNTTKLKDTEWFKANRTWGEQDSA